MLYDLKNQIIKRFGSQYSFAKRMGIREELVSRYICCRNKLNPQQVYEWGQVLGCDVQAILDESEKAEQARAAE